MLNTSRSEITRAFGVSSRAYAPPPGGIPSTSFDTMLWRWATASGPDILTSARSGTTVMTAAYNRAAAYREAADYAACRAPARTGRPARPGSTSSRIPPGQYYTDKWPVLHAGSVPRRRPRDLGLPGVRPRAPPAQAVVRRAAELGERETTADIHCVTRWSRLDMPWRGVPVRALLEAVEPLESVRFVIAHAEQGFTANLPIEAIDDDAALLAYEADGAPLTPEHGYPLRLMVPSRYFWKSAKWLRGLEFSDVDRPGFWEGYGYHNDADPWKEERYGF